MGTAVTETQGDFRRGNCSRFLHSVQDAAFKQRCTFFLFSQAGREGVITDSAVLLCLD